MHVVNKKSKESKQKKNKIKIQSTNHLNSSSHLILILCMEYIHLFISCLNLYLSQRFFCLFVLQYLSQRFFCLFVLQYFFDRNSLVCVSCHTKWKTKKIIEMKNKKNNWCGRCKKNINSYKKIIDMHAIKKKIHIVLKSKLIVLITI